MERKLKLIWDFRGPVASKTAQHHVIHLNEYIVSEELSIKTTGYQDINELHCIAYMIVTDSEMKKVRDALKPHRGQLFEE
ncbi:hypothetical protein SAMN04487910_3428 [Aquimarina amphilecti]|uniref:Uncharacterized protein n=1 Tax=Aquimarina amphilecti TaxID=1038014 RepID=A0A1H7TGW3_AQUAM|nr:hypothetical protein [Aquimarina amphilecti]SEL83953.1 hypothetical protein SAMN04487910_3428 [Aquimarina amphilecti]